MKKKSLTSVGFFQSVKKVTKIKVSLRGVVGAHGNPHPLRGLTEDAVPYSGKE